MRQTPGRLALFAALIGGSCSAVGQSADEGRRIAEKIKAMEEARKAAPVSPTGRPMEAEWAYAPEAPNGRLGDKAGPFLISRWGNIVIRGRREGDRIVSAFTTVQCGRDGNPATRVTLLGKAPDNLCKNVKATPPRRTKSFYDQGFRLFGAADGWTMMEFAQTVGDVFFSGWPPAGTSGPNQVGVTSNGAFFLDQGGKHVFYAPGESVEVIHGHSIVVKPVMDPDEIEAELVASAMRALNDPALAKIGRNEPAEPHVDNGPGEARSSRQDDGQPARQDDSQPSRRVNFFDLAGLLAVIGGVSYGLWRWMKRRRGALPDPHPPAIVDADPVARIFADAAQAGVDVTPVPTDATQQRDDPPA